MRKDTRIAGKAFGGGMLGLFATIMTALALGNDKIWAVLWPLAALFGFMAAIGLAGLVLMGIAHQLDKADKEYARTR